MPSYLKEILQPEVQAFIRDHALHDPFALTLQAQKYPNLPIQAIAEQIGARQKARHKLPEWYQTDSLVFPPGIPMEQCSSEITAKYKGTLVSGHYLLDLTGGMGVDTFYLSQAFQQTDYVEKNAELAILTRHNFQALGTSDIRVHCDTAEHFLQNCPGKPSVIYLDPDRRDAQGHKTFSFADASPNVLALIDLLMQKADTILIKTSPLLDIDLAIKEMRFVQKVIVIAVDNECKEVLYLLRAGENPSPEITAINLSAKGKIAQEFSFIRAQEATAIVNYAGPMQYVYEPNAAVLKAGAFKAVAMHYNLQKLHPNSHLYTSAHQLLSFPGRIFVVRHSMAYNTKALKKILPDGKANITVRNFPDTVNMIRKKTRLKESKNTYLLATTGPDNRPIVLICEKLQ